MGPDEMRAHVAEAIEMVVDEGMSPLALLPNDLGVEDGRFEWSEQELNFLLAALVELFGGQVLTVDGSPLVYTGTLKICEHPDLPVALFAQAPTDLGHVVMLLAEPDFFDNL